MFEQKAGEIWKIASNLNSLKYPLPSTGTAVKCKQDAGQAGVGRRCRSGLWALDSELQAESPPQRTLVCATGNLRVPETQ